MSTRIVYVPLADVAAACGVSQYALQVRHMPAHWAVPRDYQLLRPRYTCLVAEASLPDLVAQLQADGLPEAAARLDAWRAEIATPDSHEEFVARHATPHFAAGSGGTVEAPDLMTARRIPAAPARTTVPAGGWLNEWEKEHT